MITEKQIKIKLHTVYRGMRDDGITEVRVNGKLLHPRHDLLHYSDMFKRGDSNADAQLALAILAHALNDDAAAKLAHLDFKFDVLSRLSHDEWAVERESILHWFTDWSKTNLQKV